MAAVLLAAVVATAGLTVAPAAARDRSPNACAGFDADDGEDRSAGWRKTQRCVRINQIQVMGTHNSYKLDATPEILDGLAALDPQLASEIAYRHVPLAEQFDTQEVRQIELDVFADPDGGLFTDRKALDFLGLPDEPDPALFEPGYKVLHVQEVDFNSSCLTLQACLTQVETWSDAHPRHLPITILIELKQDVIPDPLLLEFVHPIPIDAELLADLDTEIAAAFDPDDLITPDDVRGDHPTLDAAVRSGGWPTLRDARGKVMLVMDNGGTIRDLYRQGRPALEGAPIFTNATAGAADAAFIKVNEPRGNEAHIQSLVADGYVVRTRSDSPTIEARSGDRTRLEAALASGAQWVSTDYPVPGRSEWSDYVAQIPDGAPARCNPVNTGPRCRNHLLERLRR
ncbi:MAG: phosphatidylinositol-specific phospholipase C1-like protein [Acidimicrobiia bacterium]|nr:phosphatidylinositol-specific phospholipase C1-like protein [Acidimicrobiia bacterium]